RVSYYRGVLAKIAENPGAREFFIDALLDSFLAPRAAVQLVDLGELHIPAVRTVLEMAAAARTRNAEVYLALTKIYSDDVHRIEEAVRVFRKSAEPEIRPRVAAGAGDPEPQRRHYARVMGDHFRYDLFSESESEPR